MLKDDFDTTDFRKYLNEERSFVEIYSKYGLTLQQLKCMLIAIEQDSIVERINGKYKIKERR